MNWGIVETAHVDVPGAPDELSFYAGEGNRFGEVDPAAVQPGLRRYTLRKDGFVSINTPLSGGELVTKPLTFKGDSLTLNVATSAAGTVLVELQDETGQPRPGFSLNECVPLFGNSLDKVVRWESDSEVKDIAGQQVRIRFVMSDADLYSFRFGAGV